MRVYAKKFTSNQRHDAGELGGRSFLAFFGEVSIFPAQKSIDFSQTARLKITDLSGKKKRPKIQWTFFIFCISSSY